MVENKRTNKDNMIELSEAELQSMIAEAEEEGFRCGMKYKEAYERLKETVNCTALNDPLKMVYCSIYCR